MNFKSFTFDAIKQPKKKEFKTANAAEVKFRRALKKVARVSGHIVEAHIKGTKIDNELAMTKALREYANLIEPWAARQSAKMLEHVDKSNKRAFNKNANTMAEILKSDVAESEVGKVAEQLMLEQVALIKSIPLEAGMRAQELATRAIYEGTRADEIAKELMRTTEVTESRATLIAITETARANASISQARATAVGAKGYIWRATMDQACRESHRKMNGKYVLYSKPPTLSDGTTGHAGTFPRCRCYQDPVFDD